MMFSPFGPRARAITFVGFVVALAAAPAAGGQPAALRERLEATSALSCRFTALATGTWTDGTAATEVSEATLEVSFTNVNVDEGTADAGSQFGTSFIVVRYSNDYLHFMQMHLSGPLYTTTVLARETRDGRLMAVHTRHEYTDVRLPGFTSRPEMYVGDCAIE